MDKELLQKFFRNQCNADEIKQVYNWFQTAEGKAYFENSLDNDVQRYSDDEHLLLFPEVPSNKIFSRINETRAHRLKPVKRSAWHVKIAVAAIFCVSLLTGYWLHQTGTLSEESQNEIQYLTFSTLQEQHRIISLSDGSKIRINSNSKLEVPEQFTGSERHVYLDGEAWFQIADDSERPFTVFAGPAVINVLGTEFNVKIDSVAKNIQVAVSEGLVALQSEPMGNSESIRATLSGNNFALYYPEADEIIIENAPVINYLSWIDGKLFFFDDPLWQVSRTLARLYNTPIGFSDDELRNITLSADITRGELTEVLEIIARTLNIQFEIDEHSNGMLWSSKHITNNQ